MSALLPTLLRNARPTRVADGPPSFGSPVIYGDDIYDAEAATSMVLDDGGEPVTLPANALIIVPVGLRRGNSTPSTVTGLVGIDGLTLVGAAQAGGLGVPVDSAAQSVSSAIWWAKTGESNLTGRVQVNISNSLTAKTAALIVVPINNDGDPIVRASGTAGAQGGTTQAVDLDPDDTPPSGSISVIVSAQNADSGLGTQAPSSWTNISGMEGASETIARFHGSYRSASPPASATVVNYPAADRARSVTMVNFYFDE